MIKIEKTTEYESLWPLLLLADPARQAINEYISESEIFISRHKKLVTGVCVLLKNSDNEYEIKNIAVAPFCQKQGIGTALLKHATSFIASKDDVRLKVCTGNSSTHQLEFYKKSGFKIQNTIKGYFTEKYPEVIIENGVECEDLIILLK